MKTMRALGVLLVGTLLGFGVGCGSKSSVTIEEACTSVAASACAKINTCFSFIVTSLYGDAATCQTRAKLGCVQTGIPAGSATTPDDVQSCGDAYAGLSCNDAISHSPPNACRSKAGSVVNGAACSDDAQCASTHCAKTSDCGICAAVAAAGGTCATENDCDYGLICNQSKVCVAPAAAGAACAATGECASPLICSGQKCSAAVAVGGVCDKTMQNCDSRQGLYCNTQNVCVAITFAGPGEACGIVGMAFVGCKASGQCKTSGAMGTCVAPAADGAACDTDTPCLAPAKCTSGICKLSNPASCG